MPYPNPAGYYGLKMPEGIEKEIAELGYFELVEEFHLITYSLTPQGRDPIFDHLGCDADDWYAELEISDRLSLVRWIAEILAVTYNE
jgi:hypothetical protein